MKTTLLRYNVLIKKEGTNYIAYVPTLGISDFGKTLDDTQRHIKQAIAIHIEGLIKTGADVPAPDATEFYVSQTEINLPKAVSITS